MTEREIEKLKVGDVVRLEAGGDNPRYRFCVVMSADKEKDAYKLVEKREVEGVWEYYLDITTHAAIDLRLDRFQRANLDDAGRVWAEVGAWLRDQREVIDKTLLAMGLDEGQEPRESHRGYHLVYRP